MCGKLVGSVVSAPICNGMGNKFQSFGLKARSTLHVIPKLDTGDVGPTNFLQERRGGDVKLVLMDLKNCT